MNDKQRKAMFTKGKIKYKPFSEAKKEFRTIAKREGIITLKDWNNYIARQKLPVGIPKKPEVVYSKANVYKNHHNGIDVKNDGVWF